MSEEDILKECTELAENEHHELGDCWDEEYSSSAIFGLIMLYKQTKKELNNIKEIEQQHRKENGKLRVELEQEKENNKELETEFHRIKSLDFYKIVEDIETGQLISKDKIKNMMKYREFELQQEYKEFEEDVEWRTYKKILEEK